MLMIAEVIVLSAVRSLHRRMEKVPRGASCFRLTKYSEVQIMEDETFGTYNTIGVEKNYNQDFGGEP